MVFPTTFGQLRKAINTRTLECMPADSAGYFFFDRFFEEYLELDADREMPKFPCHQLEIDSDEKYQKALDEMPLTDDFLNYLENRAKIIVEPIDRSLDTGEDEQFLEALENHNQTGGEAILEFFREYREAAAVS